MFAGEDARRSLRLLPTKMGGLSDLTRTGVGLRVLFRGLDGFVHIPNVVPRELVLAARTMPCFYRLWIELKRVEL